MNTKLLISTFIIIIIAGFTGGLCLGLVMDGGTDAVVEPAENGSLVGSFDPNEPYCVYCQSCPRSEK